MLLLLEEKKGNKRKMVDDNEPDGAHFDVSDEEEEAGLDISLHGETLMKSGSMMSLHSMNNLNGFGSSSRDGGICITSRNIRPIFQVS